VRRAATVPKGDAAMFEMTWDAATLDRVWYSLTVLMVAALLGAALGLVRPVRRGIVPRSSHIIQAQILLAVVGAIIVVVVAESLARAFAVVGAAGLIRYRTRIEDPKDASVMLVALTVGLAAGSGLFLFATLGSVFVIGVLWLLESFEPAARTRFDLKVVSKQATALQPEIEAALTQKGVTFELRGSADDELAYEVTVPYHAQIRQLTCAIRELGAAHHVSVEWEIKKYETVMPWEA
jgi:ABC-type Fe3+ transport system permease subunit